MKKTLMFILMFIMILCFVGCTDKTCTEHEEGDWEIVTEATCASYGEKVKKCTKCGLVLETASIEKSDHTIITIEGVEPTCLESGLTEGSKCSVCGKIITSQDTVKALGHKYVLSEEKSNSEILVYECTRCGDIYTEENTTGCTNHEKSDWIITKEPTCLDKGLKIIKCLNCGATIKSEEIDSLGHKEITIARKEATCEEDGLTEGIKCDRCGKIIKEQEVINKLNHNYELITTVASTKTTEGYLEYKCTRCEKTYRETLPLVTDYDETKPISIILSDNGSIVQNSNGGVLIDNNAIKIVLAGEYSITGKLSEGNIVVSVSENDDVIINLEGVEITSSTSHPVFIESADKVEISAKSKTENYIYDKREYSDAASGGAVYAKCDLQMKGKGSLTIESTYNNGLAATKDLKIKNLTLNVKAVNNAIKGNDSITIDSGTIKAVSTKNDALKTTDSDVSSKGNQRGIVTINEGTIDLYSACDGIDASYDVIINGGVINIYTDKYSEYSEEVLVTKSNMYIRLSQRMGRTEYSYSVKFYDENNNVTMVNAKNVTDGPMSYAILDKPNNAQKMVLYIYNKSQVQGSETYVACTDLLTVPESKDLYSISKISSGQVSGSWGNYSSSGRPGGFGPGGMQDGNQDKALYSCKGIKADNEITINGGNINIKSHDDGLHTNNDVTLENGSTGLGNITINNGNITIYSDDDGLHADETVNIKGGNIIITNSYEGVEGEYINFIGGTTQIKSSDDGINALTNLNISGGLIYLDADGDGIDSNGTITMSGGTVLARGSKNGGNGVLDFDRTFTFTGGILLAIGCRGMDQKPTAANGATAVASTIQTTTSSYVNVVYNEEIICTIKVTKQNQNYCVLAYGSDYSGSKVTITTSTENTLTNDLYFVK